MCVNCTSDGIGRRDFMKFSAAGAIALGVGGAARAEEGAPTALSPQDALAALKSGNERYVSSPELCTSHLAESRTAVAAHQAPWATIISCADSRVTPELIFASHGVGEVFVACRHPRTHRLRRGEGGMRHCDQERDLSRRHRPHDRAHRAGGACGAQ